MFQFRRFPAYTYLIQCTLLEYCSSGFPHSEISGSQDICSSPKLIAACHVLRRLLMPRHSPCALSSLTYSNNPLLDWFSVRIMQAIHSVSQNCNCYPHLFRCCSVVPQLNITFSFKLSFERPLCCLANYFQIFFVQFSRCKFLTYYCQISKSNLLGSEIQQQFTVWWARVGSNHRPYDYQSYALAS